MYDISKTKEVVDICVVYTPSYDNNVDIHQGLGYLEIFMLVNKDFQNWQLIGWQHSRQPIRSHVRKFLFTNMEFNMDFT